MIESVISWTLAFLLSGFLLATPTSTHQDTIKGKKPRPTTASFGECDDNTQQECNGGCISKNAACNEL